MYSFFGLLAYGAKYLFKTGIGLAAPWAAPLIKRPWLIIGLGLAIAVLPFVFNHAGKRTVVADVSRQALEIQNKDAAENIELAKDQERLANDVHRAEIEKKQTENRVINETFKDDEVANEWASQSLPAGVLDRLR